MADGSFDHGSSSTIRTSPWISLTRTSEPSATAPPWVARTVRRIGLGP